MRQSEVESKVAELRCEINPEQCDVEELKRKLPKDLRNCPKSILHQSMAYGNSPDELASIVKSKMNDTNGDENPTDTSLENIVGPLTKLKKDLDKNPARNIFKVIRQFNDDQIDVRIHVGYYLFDICQFLACSSSILL